jgi:hypothetical protein
MEYLKMHQMTRGDACCMMWVCAEPTLGFDFGRAAKIGLKVGLPRNHIPQLQEMRLLRGVPPLTDAELSVLTQTVGELVIVQAHTGEEALDAVLRGVESNIFGIIVIDSLSNLIPSANADRELDEENKRAAHATLLTDFVKHMSPLLNKFGTPNYTTIIGIAQARANSAKATAGPKARYMKDWEVPIAWSWKHAALQNILIWNGSKIERQHGKMKYTVGKSVHWSIGKGKAGAHEHVSGEYEFFFDDVCPELGLRYGADRAETMLIEGMRAGVIREHRGSIVLVRPSDNSALMDDIPGLPTLKQLIQVDFNLEQMLRQEIMAARGVECRYL